MDNFLQLKHPIDLRIDYAFKVLFATKGNEPILVDFLNVFLQPKIPIQSVELLNPYNDKEFDSEKLSIVDVKAKDTHGNIYQIEMQIGNKSHLKQRVIFTWSQIYSKQIKTGESVGKLNRVISIWLLTDNLIRDNRFQHIIEARYRHNKKLFIDHMEIHLLELNKWRPPKRFTKKHLWAYIFSGPHDSFELPILFKTPIMRRVMSELIEISEKEIKWHRYLSRKLYLHDQATAKEAEEENKVALEKFKIAFKETKESLDKAQSTLNETQQELDEAQQQLESERSLRQEAQRRETELLEQLAKLKAEK